MTDEQLALMQGSAHGPPPLPAAPPASAPQSGSTSPSRRPAPEPLVMHSLPMAAAAAQATATAALPPIFAGGPVQPLPPTPRAPGFLPPASVVELEAQGAALLAQAGTHPRLSSRHPFAFASLQTLTVSGRIFVLQGCRPWPPDLQERPQMAAGLAPHHLPTPCLAHTPNPLPLTPPTPRRWAMCAACWKRTRSWCCAMRCWQRRWSGMSSARQRGYHQQCLAPPQWRPRGLAQWRLCRSLLQQPGLQVQ